MRQEDGSEDAPVKFPLQRGIPKYWTFMQCVVLLAAVSATGGEKTGYGWGMRLPWAQKLEIAEKVQTLGSEWIPVYDARKRAEGRNASC